MPPQNTCISFMFTLANQHWLVVRFWLAWLDVVIRRRCWCSVWFSVYSVIRSITMTGVCTSPWPPWIKLNRSALRILLPLKQRLPTKPLKPDTNIWLYPVKYFSEHDLKKHFCYRFTETEMSFSRKFHHWLFRMLSFTKNKGFIKFPFQWYPLALGWCSFKRE